MPHCIIEYSSDIEQLDKIRTTIQMAHKALVDSTLFSSENIKVRAVPVTFYLVGGVCLPFIHTTLRILPGRTDSQKQILSQALLETVSNQFVSIDNITVDIIEMNPHCYSKKNKA